MHFDPYLINYMDGTFFLWAIAFLGIFPHLMICGESVEQEHLITLQGLSIQQQE
jgi:hypothetical protein